MNSRILQVTKTQILRLLESRLCAGPFAEPPGRPRFFKRRLVGQIAPVASRAVRPVLQPPPIQRPLEAPRIVPTTREVIPDLVAIDGIRVAPIMVPYVQRLRQFAQTRGFRFSLTSGFRSLAEQAALRLRWQRGDPSVIFPPAEFSYHTQGLAVDISSDHLRELGTFAESIGMRWGGRFGDPVHFDLGRR